MPYSLAIFDLDGTIADIGHRVHFVRGGNKDWESFFAGCVADTPNWPVVRAFDAHIMADHTVEIWSARSDIVRPETEAWLQLAAGIDPAYLTHMRSAGDNTPDVELKRYWLHQLHESERPDIVYDDRQRVVAFAQSEKRFFWRVLGRTGPSSHEKHCTEEDTQRHRGQSSIRHGTSRFAESSIETA